MKKIDTKKYIGKEVKVIIDRPLGSRHPKHNLMYCNKYILKLTNIEKIKKYG